jgi:hypothetical protein
VQAGNGNVIIAGSVTTGQYLSSFSNKAGTQAAWYLAALGEGICCRYANGNIEYITKNGSTYYTVYDGTSFAAPQITGAVALLLQAFPKLTAIQAVQLLLNTATRTGSGNDPTIGMGVLNIAAAFTAQGATSIASTGTQIALSATSLTTSAAMGDAAYGASLKAVVLDAYSRAFTANLAANLQSAPLPPRLTAALTSRQQSLTLGQGRVGLALTIDATGRTLALPWTGALRLSQEDAQAAKVLAGRVMARIAPNTHLAFAFSQGPDGLVASLQGQDRPAFLIAANPMEDTGFTRSAETALAVRHALGAWGLTLSAQQGKGQPATTQNPNQPADTRDTLQRFGAALDRATGPWRASLGAQWLGETRGVLGARFNPALGIHGADSLFADAAITYAPHPDIRLGAALRQGYTSIRQSSLTTASHLVTNGWVIDGSIANMFSPDDLLALRLSQPLRVSQGGLNFLLPTAYDYDTGALWTRQTLSLAPHGREIDAELAWTIPLVWGIANTNLFYRHNPGHYANLGDDTGASLGWKAAF